MRRHVMRRPAVVVRRRRPVRGRAVVVRMVVHGRGRWQAMRLILVIEDKSKPVFQAPDLLLERRDLCIARDGREAGEGAAPRSRRRRREPAVSHVASAEVVVMPAVRRTAAAGAIPTAPRDGQNVEPIAGSRCGVAGHGWSCCHCASGRCRPFGLKRASAANGDKAIAVVTAVKLDISVPTPVARAVSVIVVVEIAVSFAVVTARALAELAHMASPHRRRLAHHGVGLVEAVLGLVGLHAVCAWLFSVTPDFAPTAL